MKHTFLHDGKLRPHKHTHPEYIIHIASPRQRLLRERATMFVYMYIVYLVYAGKLRPHKHTHPEYIIHIASPRQRWLRERATMLVYMYIVYLVYAGKLSHTNTHTPRIYNTYCFSTAKMVTRTRHYVRLYLHCLSSINLSSTFLMTPSYICALDSLRIASHAEFLRLYTSQHTDSS